MFSFIIWVQDLLKSSRFDQYPQHAFSISIYYFRTPSNLVRSSYFKAGGLCSLHLAYFITIILHFHTLFPQPTVEDQRNFSFNNEYNKQCKVRSVNTVQKHCYPFHWAFICTVLTFCVYKDGNTLFSHLIFCSLPQFDSNPSNLTCPFCHHLQSYWYWYGNFLGMYSYYYPYSYPQTNSSFPSRAWETKNPICPVGYVLILILP